MGRSRFEFLKCAGAALAGQIGFCPAVEFVVILRKRMSGIKSLD
jgi:hypothetical protein